MPGVWRLSQMIPIVSRTCAAKLMGALLTAAVFFTTTTDANAADLERSRTRSRHACSMSWNHRYAGQLTPLAPTMSSVSMV